MARRLCSLSFLSLLQSTPTRVHSPAIQRHWRFFLLSSRVFSRLCAFRVLLGEFLFSSFFSLTYSENLDLGRSKIAWKVPFFDNRIDWINVQASRSYAQDARGRSNYDLFGQRKPGDEEFRKSWEKKMNEEASLWEDSDGDEMDMKDNYHSDEDVKKLKEEAEERSKLIDADDSDELRSVWSGSDEEKTLWTGDEGDDDDDIPTEAVPNERSDPYIDKLFEFDEKPKYRTISELLKDEEEPKELSPGKQARKIAVENALKKLKKGPDGRYTNVWEVMTDLDILIGAFENIVSGPEYAELREGGPKKLNMQFFKDIQARMRDPNFKFSPELKLKPKSKLVPKKKWQKAQSRRKRAAKR